jgi:hypothetical protein
LIFFRPRYLEARKNKNLEPSRLEAIRLAILEVPLKGRRGNSTLVSKSSRGQQPGQPPGQQPGQQPEQPPEQPPGQKPEQPPEQPPGQQPGPNLSKVIGELSVIQSPVVGSECEDII